MLQRKKRHLFQAMLLLFTLLGGTALQAETTECTEITEIPVVIKEQGVYCFKQNLSANLASGAAIAVATNNVTIDLNGYKLGNLAGGPGTEAVGINAANRANVVVRNGIIRGFLIGVFFSGAVGIGGANVAEDLRMDGNTRYGIRVSASPDVVLRNNIIVETGGSTVSDVASAIFVEGPGAKIIGNDIGGVFSAGTSPARGIEVSGNNAQILNNSVMEVEAPSEAFEHYISYAGAGAIIDGNRFIDPEGDGKAAIHVAGGSVALCSDNSAVGFMLLSWVNCAPGSIGNIAVK